MKSTTYIAALAAAIADHQRHLRALLKAQLEAERGNVPEKLPSGNWAVKSTSTSLIHVVGIDPAGNGCTCPAGQNHKLCWHMEAMHIACVAEAAELVSMAPDAPNYTAEELEAMTLGEFMDDVLHCEKVA